jgi:hypothetical protein
MVIYIFFRCDSGNRLLRPLQGVASRYPARSVILSTYEEHQMQAKLKLRFSERVISTVDPVAMIDLKMFICGHFHALSMVSILSNPSFILRTSIVAR